VGAPPPPTPHAHALGLAEHRQLQGSCGSSVRCQLRDALAAAPSQHTHLFAPTLAPRPPGCAGIDTGSTIQVTTPSGGANAPRMRVLLRVEVESHPVFRRDGPDIHISHDMRLAQALLGMRTQVRAAVWLSDGRGGGGWWLPGADGGFLAHYGAALPTAGLPAPPPHPTHPGLPCRSPPWMAWWS
jgi:hypothetical protein